jgi:hypothetical protein
MVIQLLLIFFLLINTAKVFERKQFKLEIHEENTNFRIFRNNELFLTSGSPTFYINKQWWSTTGENQTNKLEFLKTELINDNLFETFRFYFNAENTPLELSFLIYFEEPLIIFEQFFNDGANGTQIGNRLQNFNDLSTIFPRISNQGGKIKELGYFTFKNVTKIF